MREVQLHDVGTHGPAVPLSQALARRRSTRDFGSRPVSLGQVSRLLWAAQGRPDGEHRTGPSAGALYPLALSVVAGEVEDLAPGVYRHDPAREVLQLQADVDYRDRVAATTFVDEAWLRTAGLLLLVSGATAKVTHHFADQAPAGRGERYLWLEAGHVSQSLYLQAAAEDLGAVVVAGFHDDRLLELMQHFLPEEHQPLVLFGVGAMADQR